MVQKKPKVTACLIVWKRQRNMPKIIEHLMGYDFIDEIIIRDNSKAKNIKSYGRYTSAKKAKNDLIYTQDDDCLVKNLEDVYEMAIRHPQLLTHSGTAEYEKVISDNIYGGAQMAMAGWGYFFQKKWIPVLDKYIKKYGADYCFLRETDRIFSMLLNQHHIFVRGDIEHLDGHNGEEAMSFNNEEHLKYKQLAISRCLDILNESSNHNTDHS